MREHIFICEFDKTLLDQLHNKCVVVKTSDCERIHDILQHVTKRNIRLHCILIEHNGSLASVPFHESWRKIPMAIFANVMGSFKEIMGRLPILREHNLRIFLNTDNKENFTSLHILSSLGIDCGVYFGDNEKIDWDSMNDLMTYSVYGKVGHGTIEPFYYTVSRYNPANLTDYSMVYFDNPRQYLHIDKAQNIALTASHLKEGKYITQGLTNLNQPDINDKIEDYLLSWQEFFLKEDGCAYCQGWRVCMGKFSETYIKNQGCRQFFVDIMDAADHFLQVQQKNKRKELWQP